MAYYKWVTYFSNPYKWSYGPLLITSDGARFVTGNRNGVRLGLYRTFTGSFSSANWGEVLSLPILVRHVLCMTFYL